MQSKFFKTDSDSMKDLKIYGPKMKCIDDDSMSIFGHYDSSSANNLMIVFEKCNPE